jgi:protein-tyrosine-phosphatase
MSDPRAPARVLFLSTTNASRSQMAEAFARQHGGGRVEAFSAGTDPAERVQVRAVLFMDEIDLDLTPHRPRSLDEVPPGPYDALVAIGCRPDVPGLEARLREEWQVPDPTHLSPAEFRAVRNLIESRVKDLLARL